MALMREESFQEDLQVAQLRCQRNARALKLPCLRLRGRSAMLGGQVALRKESMESCKR